MHGRARRIRAKRGFGVVSQLHLQGEDRSERAEAGKIAKTLVPLGRKQHHALRSLTLFLPFCKLPVFGSVRHAVQVAEKPANSYVHRMNTPQLCALRECAHTSLQVTCQREANEIKTFCAEK